MKRKDFIKNSLLATGTMLLPNAIWAFDKSINVETNALNKFVSKPNLKRFKVSEIGTKFFETELSILKPTSTLKLHRDYFISENINGICTPTLLEKSDKESFVFIPELYKDNKFNGFIVKVCEDGLCQETKTFTHENQGYYAFWGKEYLQHPTLYHYNVETSHLMRMHWENNEWVNHRVMPIYPNEMIALYQQQLQQVTTGQLPQQFGYDFEIHKDGFYQFLAVKHNWEQSIITKEKEAYELANPAPIYTNIAEVPTKNNNAINDYADPFIPVYCKGDDLSHAIIKPAVLYEEVVGTKIEIPDMPAYKTQDDLAECRAFALATILQWYTCQTWKSDIPDCKNPPADSAISYFGLMIYTNETENFGTLNFKGPAQKSIPQILEHLSRTGNMLLLDSCKLFDNLVNKFSGIKGLKKRDQFFNYIEEIYQKNTGNVGISLSYCDKIVEEINLLSGLKVNSATLKKAFAKKSYNEFLYSAVFGDCKMEAFPSGFIPMAYPIDKVNSTALDMKNKVIKGLKKGKPVLYSNLCAVAAKGYECPLSHSIVIAGYKKVIASEKNATEKELFRLHNSWGAEWQLLNNDGWVDADIFVQNTVKIKTATGDYRFSSGSVTWLEP